MRDFISISVMFGLLALCGCASKEGGAADLGADGQPLQDAPLSATGEKARRMMPNTDNGLEVRKWVITPQQSRQLQAALAESARGDAAVQELDARLERNGFRFVRVPVDEVDALIADVGGAAADVSEWHGQALDWRPLQERPIGKTPRALAIDGRVRRFDRGSIALMIRSWTVQMETGPMVHLEAVPQHVSPQATHLRNLLNEGKAPSGETFGSMGLDLLLESGFAYVMLSESPQNPWPAPARRIDKAMQPARQKQVGPFGDDVADTSAPQTLGEFQLSTDRPPPMRTVYVFVPKIAASPALNSATAHVQSTNEP